MCSSDTRLYSEMGKPKKTDKRKKSENSPDNVSEGTKQRKMAAPKQGQEQTPQASQFSYTGISQPGLCYSPQGYTMNGLMNNGMPGMVNGITVSPPIYSPHSQPLQPLPEGGDILNKILSRLDCIDTKLVRLDTIETSVSKISTKVNSMDQKVVSLESKMTAIEDSRTFDSQTMTELNNKHSAMQKDMAYIKKAQASLVENENKLKEQLIDLKCREMRDNLLFYNVKEERDETDDACVNKVLGIMEDDMKIDSARLNIKLHRAHRIGRYANGKTRPIVAKFAYYPDRERARKAGQVLRDTVSVYAVSQQYPKEVQERRRALVPIMKQARLNGSEAYIVVDKLYIDKHLYRGHAASLQYTSTAVSEPAAGPLWGTSSATGYAYAPPPTQLSTPGPAPGVSDGSKMGFAMSTPGYVHRPPPGPPPTRLSTPGSTTGSMMGFATSAPGHLFGPPPMRLSTPGHVPGSPAGSTTAWGQIHEPPLINLSTPGPAPGPSTGSTTGLTTSAPGHVFGPQHTSLPTPGYQPCRRWNLR